MGVFQNHLMGAAAAAAAAEAQFETHIYFYLIIEKILTRHFFYF